MKSLSVFLAVGLIAIRLAALETGEVSAAAKKFAGASPEEQYAARVELDRLIDEAARPGKQEQTVVTTALVGAIVSADTPAEAKKYLLRALARCGGAEAVPALTELMNGSDAILREEARLALECIPGREATGALREALAHSNDKGARMSLANSLAVRKAVSAIPEISVIVAETDPELARAGIAALAKIGGPESVEALEKAGADATVPPDLKPDLEKALLVAAGDDAVSARRIYRATTCPAVKLAAFLPATAGEWDAEKEALTLDALESDDTLLRQTALRCGLRENLETLRQKLAHSMDRFSPQERLVILTAIESVAPPDVAEMIALASAASEIEQEKAAALAALGRFGSKASFEEVLKNVSAREQSVAQAAGAALAVMPYPGAGSDLLEMLKSGSGGDKISAIVAVGFRRVESSGEALIGIAQGDDEAAAKEALKSLHATATGDDLEKLVDAVRAVSEPARKKLLISVCVRIAERLGTEEAKELVKDLP